MLPKNKVGMVAILGEMDEIIGVIFLLDRKCESGDIMCFKK
jgi:hypothetical protein